MIHEWGSPTLFFTFSSAECVPVITLPLSVSRKFSLKFHAFFRKVIIKGEVLGKVDRFY